MGVLSLLPALLDQPMARLLDELALAPELAAPLRGTAASGDRLAVLLDLVHVLEAGDWQGVRLITGAFEIPTAAVVQIYVEAVHWTDQLAAAKKPAPSACKHTTEALSSNSARQLAPVPVH